jgi:hypothetical protein
MLASSEKYGLDLKLQCEQEKILLAVSSRLEGLLQETHINIPDICTAVYGLKHWSVCSKRVLRKVLDPLYVYLDKAAIMALTSVSAHDYKLVVDGLQNHSKELKRWETLLLSIPRTRAVEAVDGGGRSVTETVAALVEELANMLAVTDDSRRTRTVAQNSMSSFLLKADTRSHSLDACQLGQIVVRLGTLTAETREVRDLLSVLLVKVVASPPIFSSGLEIANIFSGFQSMHSDHEVVRHWLSLLSRWLHDTDGIVLTPNDIARCIFGMQNMNCELPVVRQIVEQLSRRVDALHGCFNCKDIQLSFAGLQNMCGDLPEVKTLLHKLSMQMERSALENCDALTVSVVLNGMKNMSSTDSAVVCVKRQVLRMFSVTADKTQLTAGTAATMIGSFRILNGRGSDRPLINRLLPVIRDCQGFFTAPQFVETLEGLQDFPSNLTETQHVLQGICRKFAYWAKEDRFTALMVTRALGALAQKECHYPEVRKVISLLTPKIAGCQEVMTAHQLGAAMIGLQNMTSKSSEVKDLLAAMVVKVSSCPEYLDKRSLDNVTYGLLGMDMKDAEVKDLLVAVESRLIPPP